MPDRHDRELAVAEILQEHWPFSGGFVVNHCDFPPPVTEIEYDGGSFLVDGKGRCWALEEHICDNLPARFFQELEALAEGDA